MKQLMLGTVLLALLSAPLWADQAADRTAIEQRHQEWTQVWNAHDVGQFAQFWKSDGDLMDPSGEWLQGRDAVAKYFEKQMAANGPLHGTTYSGKITNIRFVDENTAIVDVDAQLTGMKAGEPSKYHVTWVAKKEQGKWMAVACREFVPHKMEASAAPNPPHQPKKH